MEQMIAKLLQDFEQGNLTRRQLIQSLALAAAAAAAVVPAASAAGTSLNAESINHISYQVADYRKTRDFYVDLFGWKATNDDGTRCRFSIGDVSIWPRNRPAGVTTSSIDHISYGIADFDKDAVEAELKRRGLSPKRGVNAVTFHFNDPDGFDVEVGAQVNESR